MANYENLRLDRQLCFALYNATNSITRMYSNLLKAHDLTHPQYLVLLVLWDKNGIHLKELMRRLNLDSGTLSPIVKRLQKAGLVDKIRTNDDERIVLIKLTTRAMELQPIIADIQRQVACQTDLSSTEFFELLDRLHKLASCPGNKEASRSAAS